MVDTAIGKVIYGMDTLKAMEDVPVNEKYRPTQDIVIKSVTIHANPFAVSCVCLISIHVFRVGKKILGISVRIINYHKWQQLNSQLPKLKEFESEMEKKIVGIDCDEVLCLLMADFIQYMNQETDLHMKYEDLKEYDLNKYFHLDQPKVCSLLSYHPLVLRGLQEVLQRKSEVCRVSNRSVYFSCLLSLELERLLWN